jgi:hypothetical protein
MVRFVTIVASKSEDSTLDVGIVGLLPLSPCHFTPRPTGSVSPIQSNTDYM